MSRTYRAVVLADDLTGAAEAADAFARNGFATQLHLGPADHGDALPAGGPTTEVLAIDGDLRATAVDEVAAEVRHLLDGVDLGTARLFVKIDSLLRGPLGPIVAGVSSTLTDAIILCCPALPAHGRITEDGVQYLHGVPLSDTDAWSLEPGPAPTTVARAFAPRPTRPLAGSTAADLRDAAPGTVWIADADSAAQLDDLVRLGLDPRLDRPVVFLGTLALAAALAAQLAAGTLAVAEDSGTPACACPTTDGPLLAVVGSATPAAARQARALVDDGARPVALSASALAHRDATGTDEILDRLSGGDVVVTVEGDESAQNAQIIADVLAQVVAPTVGHAGVLALTGGHTARRVLDASGVTVLTPCRPAHTAADAGVVTCSARLSGGTVPVITKAGSFGHSQTLVQAVRAVRSRGHVS